MKPASFNRFAVCALFCALTLLACKSEPRLVDEKSVLARVKKYLGDNAAKLSTPERLTPMVLTTYGIPEHEHTRFLEIYRHFLEYRDHLPQSQQRADPALRLTLELSHNDPGTSLLGVTEPKAVDGDDPAYMAYLLHLADEVDSSQFSKPGYIQRLSGLFRVTPRQIKRGLWIALQLDLNTLANAVVGLMEAEFKRTNPLTADRLADAVLSPFLTFVSRGFTLTEENETAIAKAFGDVYGDRKIFEKAFEQLRYHLNREADGVSKLHLLNSKLSDKKLFFYLLPGQVTLHQPTSYRIEIANKKLTTVRVVQGRGPAMRQLPLGCWAYANREVVLPADSLASKRDMYRALVEHGTLPRTVDEATERMWREQSLSLDTKRVQATFQELAKKGIGDADDATLLDDLFVDAAILQSRCLVDLGAAHWDSIDRSIGAFAAQIVLGRRPELGLLDFIESAQEQRRTSGDIKQSARLDALLKTLWDLAAKRQGDTLNRAALQKALGAMHDAHQGAKSQKKLPSLDAFNRSIVQAHLAKAARFEMP